MKPIQPFEEFIDTLEKQEKDKKAAEELKRFKEIAGLEKSDIFNGDYFIQVTINTPTNLLQEHEQYTQFRKTTNRYTYHPENPSIPVINILFLLPAKMNFMQLMLKTAKQIINLIVDTLFPERNLMN